MRNAIPPAAYEHAKLTSLILAYKMHGWIFQCSADDQNVRFDDEEQTLTGPAPLVLDESELPY